MSDQLPEGFILDQPDVPQGFVLDQPKERSLGQYGKDLAENAPRVALQGATMGFGDELSSAMGAAAKSVIQGVPYGPEYERQLAFQRQKIDEARQENPVASVIAEGSGAILPAIATAGTINPLSRAGLYAAANPLKAASLTGGISGGIYGFGTGEGSGEERLKQAGISSGIGTVAGPVGAIVAPKIVGAFVGLKDRAMSIFKKAPMAAPQAAPVPSALSGTPINQLPTVPELSQQSGVMRLPTGAATGDVELMRKAEAARQGALGPELQAQMAQVDDLAKQDALNAAQSLAGGTTQSSQDTLYSVVDMTRKRAMAEKRLASTLMNQRNKAIADTSVWADYTNDTLGQSVKEMAKTPDFKVFLATSEGADTAAKLKYLDGLLKTPKGGKNKAVNFADITAWRQSLGKGKVGTQEGVFYGQLSKTYDDWLDGITEDAFKNGDTKTIDAIFKANKNYRQFKEKYGTNKYTGQSRVIQNILEKSDLEPSQLVNMVFGKKISGETGTVQNVKRILTALPDGKKQIAQDTMRNGLMQRVIENSYDPVSGNVSFKNLKNGLLEIKNSPSYQNYLKNPDHEKVVDKLIVDLDKYINSTTRRDVYSPSGPLVVRALDSVLNGLGKVTAPFGGRVVTETLKKGTAEAALAPDKRAVEKQIGDLVNTMRANSPSLAVRLSGATSGAVITSPDKKPFITDANGNQYFIEDK